MASSNAAASGAPSPARHRGGRRRRQGRRRSAPSSPTAAAASALASAAAFLLASTTLAPPLRRTGDRIARPPFFAPPFPSFVVAAAAAAAAAAEAPVESETDASDAAVSDPLPDLDEEEVALLDDLASRSAAEAPPPPSSSLSDATSALSDRVASLSESASRAGDLVGAIDGLRRRREALLERTRRLEAEVRRRNAAELRRLLARLNDTLREELRRRDVLDATMEEIREEEAERRRRREEREEERRREREERRRNRVTVEELEEALDPDAILGESEAELEDWVMKLAREELAKVVEEERARLEERARAQRERAKCVSPPEAGSLVLEDLTRHAADGIGRYDHASLDAGGSISYADGMTSDPYDPGADIGTVPLGEVWWRRYIPEDWEGLLPDGWEHWGVPAEGLKGLVPSYVWSSLGLKSAPIQPAESVLSSNTNVGSCYPLPGRSGGRVTVRLPYPVDVDAVTVDHVPAALGGERGRSSAVRHFRVVGYPPCPEKGNGGGTSERETKECERIGFDGAKSVDLGSHEYRIVSAKLDRDGNAVGGRSVQTFNVTEALARAALLEEESDAEGREDEEEDDEEEEEEEEEEEDSGMCTAEKASSCGGPDGTKKKKRKKSVVRGVAIIAEGNWGTEEYTCLYRFRVHGKKVE